MAPFAPVPAPALPPSYRFESDPEAVQARMADIHAALNHESIYWGKERSQEMLAQQIRQSWRVVMILYDGERKEGELAAVARVVGDGFGYLADVTTVHRNKGLSLPLVHNAIHSSSNNPDKPSRQWHWCLITKASPTRIRSTTSGSDQGDAFRLYEKVGFRRELPLGMWLMPTEGPGVL